MKTINISGMGGEYEFGCQKMLQQGLKWLENNPRKRHNVKFETYQGIYGVCNAKSTEAKEMEEAMLKDVSDCTGAMHHAVVGHLIFIAQNSYQKWLEEFSEDRKFEFDGSQTCIPARD